MTAATMQRQLFLCAKSAPSAPHESNVFFQHGYHEWEPHHESQRQSAGSRWLRERLGGLGGGGAGPDDGPAPELLAPEPLA